MVVNEIDVDVALKIIQRYRDLQKVKIGDAKFMIDGEAISISEDDCENFRFTGLGIADFIETYDWPVLVTSPPLEKS